MPDPKTLPEDLDFTAISVYQALVLFQIKGLMQIPYGDSEATRAAHRVEVSPSAHLDGFSASEFDWMMRAQGRALERVGLIVVNQEKTRWTLTAAGESLVRHLAEEIRLRLPPPERSPS